MTVYRISPRRRASRILGMIPYKETESVPVLGRVDRMTSFPYSFQLPPDYRKVYGTCSQAGLVTLGPWTTRSAKVHRQAVSLRLLHVDACYDLHVASSDSLAKEQILGHEIVRGAPPLALATSHYHQSEYASLTLVATGTPNSRHASKEQSKAQRLVAWLPGQRNTSQSVRCILVNKSRDTSTLHIDSKSVIFLSSIEDTSSCCNTCVCITRSTSLVQPLYQHKREAFLASSRYGKNNSSGMPSSLSASRRSCRGNTGSLCEINLLRRFVGAGGR